MWNICPKSCWAAVVKCQKSDDAYWTNTMSDKKAYQIYLENTISSSLMMQVTLTWNISLAELFFESLVLKNLFVTTPMILNQSRDQKQPKSRRLHPRVSEHLCEHLSEHLNLCEFFSSCKKHVVLLTVSFNFEKYRKTD